MGIADTDVGFERYVEHMRPYAKRIVSSHARSHPYLGEQDLLQEALEELWLIWSKFSTKLPFDDICKIGSVHMKHRMITCWQRSQTRKEGEARFVHLDAHVKGAEGTLFHDITIALHATPETGYLVREEIEIFCRKLSTDEGRVLRELLVPSEATLSNMKAVEAASKSRRTLVSERNEAIGRTLGLTSAQVGKCWKRIQQVVGDFMAGSPSPGYKVPQPPQWWASKHSKGETT
jgi:biotin operon repressor